MNRKTATAIGASVGAAVGVVSGFVYFYKEMYPNLKDSSVSEKEPILATLFLALPVVGGAIGFYASK